MNQISPSAAAFDAAHVIEAQPFDLSRRLASEVLGTALLLAIVIGSGIMGERLAGGNVALALLGNTLATGAGLVVLVAAFGPVSGAHFNPAVTLVRAEGRDRVARGRRLCRSPARRHCCRRPRRPCHVRRAHGADFSQAPGRRRPGLFRSGGDLRPHHGDPRDRPRPPADGARRGRALHHLRLLVHRLDLIRQPGGDAGAQPQRHLRRHRARLRPPLPARPGGGRFGRRSLLRLAFRERHSR